MLDSLVNVLRNIFGGKQYNNTLIKGILRFCRPVISRIFYLDLALHTHNFREQIWLGKYIMWQPPMDLWLIQEAISEIRPSLLIETGTHKGGAAILYGHLFDLLEHDGRIVSVDIEDKKEPDTSHPKVTFLIGSSTAPEIIKQLDEMVSKAQGPVMVILDSDHRPAHVERELELYPRYVTQDSYILVQDGLTDLFGKPGPLKAIKPFLRSSRDFVLDKQRTNRYIVTHHPMGWLKRTTPRPSLEQSVSQIATGVNDQLSKEIVS